MQIIKNSTLVVVISTLILSAAVAEQSRTGDLNNDYKVNAEDLFIFAEQWLDTQGCSGPGCANLNGVNGVNFADFALLAQNWLKTFDGLIINEFMASNIKTLIDGDRNSSDWIEIYNVTDTDIIVDGWFLTDNADNLQKWPFPEGITIKGGAFLFVFATGQDIDNYIDPEGNYHTNFGLNKDGEYLALVRPDGVIAHEYKNYNLGGNQFGYPPQQTDISYGTGLNALTLLDRNADAKILIPTDGLLTDQWIQEEFIEDSNWLSVKTGVGFAPPIEIEKAGDLLVDLSPQDLQLGQVYEWPNRGTLGGYFNDDGTDVWMVIPTPIVYAAGFDGSCRMKANFQAPATITEDSDWSVEVWALNESIGTREAMVQWANDLGIEEGRTCHLDYGLSGSSGAITHGGTADMGYDGGPPATGQWHHIVATYEGGPGGMETIYVDGKINAFENKTLNIYNGHIFRLGNASKNLYFTGALSAVRVHSGCLTANQVANNFLSEASYYGVPIIGDINFVAPYVTTDISQQMKSVNSTAYMRINFSIEDINTLQDTLMLDIYYDDGFIAYINGQKIISRNAPDNLTWNSTATAQRSQVAAALEAIDISGFKSLLKSGNNILAIHGLNWDKDDEDFLILPSIVSFSSNKADYKYWYFKKPTPRQPNSDAYIDIVADTRFSVERGFYDQPFQVRIAADTEGAAIRYTLDGSSPSETYGYIYDPNNPIQITTTTILRAVACKSGYKPSNVDTQTYIFLDDVINQPVFPPGFPETWGPLGNADYEMDPDVVYDPVYYPTIKQDLKTIPSVCIGISNYDFFGALEGIYANANVRELEKPASMEYIDPVTNKTYQAIIGLRSHGGVGRNDVKHALRIIAKSQYGPPKLEFPFFEDTEVDKFNSLVLRSTWNYSWIGDGTGSQAQYNRDTFSRDTVRDLGRLNPYGRHVHLYINGLYWGLYKFVERPDDGFAEEHLGGEKTDYDALKAPTDFGTDQMEVLAGDRTAWDAMFSIAEMDMSNPQNYEAIQQYLDIPAMIDYLLMIFHTGNRDAPVLLGNDYVPRNYYAIRKRAPAGKFLFIPWDCEWSLEDVGRNRVYIDGVQNPHHLYQRLLANQEFRILLADYVQKRFYNDGILTPQISVNRYMTRIMDIDRAIIGESARWGDSDRASPYTRNVEWITERNRLINDYIPLRTNIVLGQLRDWNMFPSFDAPVLKINGTPKYGGQVNSGDQLTMTTSTGTIYYTLDGSDPRTPLTGLPHGNQYTGTITLTKTTYVKARVLYDWQWSALSEATFAIGPVAQSLRITEIMYHPQETGDPNDPNEEFIEIRNISGEPVNLIWAKFSEGIQFAFPDVTLSPGQYIVVVKDFNAFESLYGSSLNTVGPYTGSLDNSGERIRLEDAIGQTILDFRYNDGWRDNTDGEGYSLTINSEYNPDPNSWGLKDSWSASTYIGGSPDAGDDGPRYGDIVINEVLAHSHALAPDWIELHNTTDHSINIGGWLLSDSDANLAKYEIAPNTTLPANGYFVLYEDVNFGPLSSDAGALIPFALSESGDEVCLSSGYNGQPTGYMMIEEFGASETDVAFGRYYKETTDTYNFVPMSTNTPSLPNAYPKVGPVVISEIMYHPEIFWGNWDAEYIELYNISDQTVNLYDVNGMPWQFTSGIDFTFPPNTTLPPYTALLLVRDVNAFNSDFNAPPGIQMFQWSDSRLNNDGEKIEISMPGDYDENGTLQYIRIDRVTYSDGSHPEDFDGITDPWPTQANGLGKSLARIDPNLYGNEPNNWQAADPTPGIVQLPSQWTMLTYDDFESGWGNYTDGGADCYLYTGTTYAHQGNNAANIQDNTGTTSSFSYTSNVDVHTPGWTQIKVDFWYKCIGFDPPGSQGNEDFWVQYYDGTNWNTVEDFIYQTDFQNDIFYHAAVYINESQYNFPTNMKIRFMCDATGDTDDVYIDEIAVTAK